MIKTTLPHWRGDMVSFFPFFLFFFSTEMKRDDANIRRRKKYKNEKVHTYTTTKNTHSRYGNHFRGKYPISPNFIPSNNLRITQALLLGHSCLLGLSIFGQSMKKKKARHKSVIDGPCSSFIIVREFYLSLSFFFFFFLFFFFSYTYHYHRAMAQFLFRRYTRRAAHGSCSWRRN